MATLEFFPIDIAYKADANRTTTYLFGRTKEGRRVCVADTSVQPGFYARINDNSRINEIGDKLNNFYVEKGSKTYKVTGTEVVERKLNGKKVVLLKVSVNDPKAENVIEEEMRKFEFITQIYEADIPFMKKYFIENDITPLSLTVANGQLVNDKMRIPMFRAESMEKGDGNKTELNVLGFDIETYNPAGMTFMPEKYPIVMIAFSGKGFKKVLTWKSFPTKDSSIEFVEDEKALLERTKAILDEQKPDVLCGYYSDGFDMPYILERAEKHNVRFDIGLDGSVPKKGINVEVTGLAHVDVLDFVKRILSPRNELESLKLDDVAKQVLGDRKDEVEIERLSEAWDSGSEELERFCKYNLKDADLTRRLFEKMYPNILELVKITNQPLLTVQRAGYGELVELFLMKRSKEGGSVIPSKPGHDEVRKRREERMEGGFLLEPEPGIYNDVFILDFRSMNPTIIVAHNISPETLNCDCCLDSPHVPGMKARFCKKKGFFPSVLQEIITRRLRVIELMKQDPKSILNARQESLKTLANSFYGYMRFFGARWYCRDCAASVSAYGRHYIQQVIKKAEDKGFKVIYSDTDSVFLAMDGKTKEDVEKFHEEVNYSLPDMMELELEGHYKSVLFVTTKEEKGAKKRYALLGDDGKVTSKGFEKRNWCKFVRKTQQELLEILLRDKNKKKAVRQLQARVGELRSKKIDKAQLVISAFLSRPLDSYEVTTPTVAVAKMMRARGETIDLRTKVRYVVTPGTGLIRERVKLPEDAEDYDADYYLNNQLLTAIEPILKTFDIDEQEVLEEKEQSSLGDFIS